MHARKWSSQNEWGWPPKVTKMATFPKYKETAMHACPFPIT